MIVIRRIYVTHVFHGFHSWSTAPEQRAYLRSPHRHLFHVKLTIDVTHADREIEFHDVQDLLAVDCDSLNHDDLGSCEHIAMQLVDAMKHRYPERRIEAEVSEDGENGGVVLWLP